MEEDDWKSEINFFKRFKKDIILFRKSRNLKNLNTIEDLIKQIDDKIDSSKSMMSLIDKHDKKRSNNDWRKKQIKSGWD